jgi:hypothetical protein
MVDWETGKWERTDLPGSDQLVILIFEQAFPCSLLDPVEDAIGGFKALFVFVELDMPVQFADPVQHYLRVGTPEPDDGFY